MTPRARFTALLNQAIERVCGQGFDPQLADHLAGQLRVAARQTFKPLNLVKDHASGVLTAIYRRTLPKGAKPPPGHGGVSMITLARLQPQLEALKSARISETVRLIEKNRINGLEKIGDKFAGWASSVPPQGMDPKMARDAKKEIKKALDGLAWEQRRVVIDQGHKLRGNIDDFMAIEGGAIAQQWHSHWRSPNYKYRPDHKARDMKYFLIRDSWALKAGFIKPDPRLPAGEQYGDQITRPGEEVFCFPASTRVPFADGIEMAYSRRYGGDLSVITTDSGKTLEATPNHPILTAHGFVAIGDLKECDEVLEISDNRLDAHAPAENHQDDGIPIIAEIFSSVAEGGVAEIRSGKAEDFHGDGSNGYINVVRATRPLRFNWQAGRAQSVNNLVLARSDDLGAACSPSHLLRLGRALTGSGLMCSLRAGLVLFRRFVLGDYHVRFLAPAGLPSSLLEPVEDLPSTNAVSLGERQDALSRFMRGADQDGIVDYLPFQMRVARVVSVRRRSFAGHVYNLQTDTGIYLANGVVVSNCRCWASAIYHLRDLPDDMLTEKGKAELARVRAA